MKKKKTCSNQDHVKKMESKKLESKKLESKPELIEIELKNESLVFFATCHCSLGNISET